MIKELFFLMCFTIAMKLAQKIRFLPFPVESPQLEITTLIDCDDVVP